MKRLLLLTVMLCGAAAAFSQNPDDESKHEQRRREKEEKTREYCMYMDSLIRSNVYVFKPNAFQMQPAGRRQQILNTQFRMDVYEDYIDIYLPFIYGFLPPYRVSTINYTITYLPEYIARQSDDGQEWTISFQSPLTGTDTYKFKMTVTTCTGDAQLDISSSTNSTISYYGFLTKIY